MSEPLQLRDWSKQTRAVVANLLEQMSNGRLKAVDHGYLALQPSDGIKRPIQNAVRILESGVSFVVADFSAEAYADQANLKTERPDPAPAKVKLLHFPTLQPQEINENAEFFTKLVRDAENIVSEGRF